MAIDLDQVRRDTPGCRHVVHFNNAGASLMPEAVVQAYTRHIYLEQDIGGYEAAAAARSTREATYDAIARLLGAAREEIALVDSATRAWNMAFYGLKLNSGDRILTAQASYASNFLAFLNRAQRDGVEIAVVPNDEHGQIDTGALREMVDDRTALIALTHVPTNGGLVNPAEEVGRIAREHEIPFLLDACQSAGQLPLDVERLKCDILSATGRKYLRGPRGTGFLYVRKSFLDAVDSPTPDLHSAEWVTADSFRLRDDARRFELWESNIAADIAFGTAVEYALGLGVENTWARIQRLADDLRSRLEEMPKVSVWDVGEVKAGIVTFSHRSRGADTIKRMLRDRDVNVSVSDPNSTLLDAEARGLPQMVRASVHYYNTQDEIDRFCASLREVISHQA